MRPAWMVLAALALALAAIVGWLLWSPSVEMPDDGRAQGGSEGASGAHAGGSDAPRGDGELHGQRPGAGGAPGERELLGTAGSAYGSSGSAPRGAAGAADPRAGERTALAPDPGTAAALAVDSAPGWIGVRLVAAGDGGPIAGALVSARASERRAEGTTGDDGRVRLGWALLQPADIAVAHPEFIDAERAGVRPGEELELFLERSGAIDGRLALAPGVTLGEGDEVLAARESGVKGGGKPISAHPDAQGCFALDDLAPGSYTLLARLADGAGTAQAGIAVESGRRSAVELDVEQPGSLAGKLRIAPGGQPLAESLLSLTSKRAGLAAELKHAGRIEVSTDSQGAFEALGLAPGPYQMEVELPWGGRYAASFEVPESGARVSRDFTVPGPARVAGSVLEPTGVGRGGSQVLVLREKDADALAALLAPAASGAGAPVPGAPTAALAATTCAGDGSFAFDALPSNEKLVLVATPGGEPGLAPGWISLAPLAPAEARAGIVVRLAASARIHGRARSPAGELLEGALLEARCRLGKKIAPSGPRAATGADGGFEIGGLPPLPTLLMARAPGCLPQVIELDLEPTGSAEVTIEFERACGIEALVVDEHGWAVEGVRLRMRSELDEPGADASLVPEAALARTDGLGRARFEELEPGAWRLELATGDWELVDLKPRRIALPADRPARAVVRRADVEQRAGLVGVVGLAGGGTPDGLVIEGVGGALVTIDGARFSVSGLAPGEVALRVRARDAAWAVVGPLELGPGEERDLGLLELDPARRISFRVSHQGSAVEKAKLRLVPLAPEQGGPDPEPPGSTLRAESEGPGRYSIATVPYGRYRLKVAAPGLKSYSRLVEVSASAAADLELELVVGTG